MALRWNGNGAVESGDGDEKQQQPQPPEEELTHRERRQISIVLKTAMDQFENNTVGTELKADILQYVSALGLALIIHDTKWLNQLFTLVKEFTANPEFRKAFQEEIHSKAKQKLGGLGGDIAELLANR